MNAMRHWALVLVLVASTALGDVTRTEEYRYPLAEGGRVSLSNVNGEIRIRGAAGEEVLIVATKRAATEEGLEKLEVVVEAGADTVSIETRHPGTRGIRWGRNANDGGSVSYELTVPATARLDAVATVNGDVSVAGVGGEVRAKTVNGDLDLEGLAADAKLETVNGGIEAEFERMGSGQRVAADTVNGRIALGLPADASAHVTADTLNGDLDATDFGLDVSKGFVGRSLDGRIGAGEGRIQLDTVNGSILIRQH